MLQSRGVSNLGTFYSGGDNNSQIIIHTFILLERISGRNSHHQNKNQRDTHSTTTAPHKRAKIKNKQKRLFLITLFKKNTHAIHLK